MCTSTKYWFVFKAKYDLTKKSFGLYTTKINLIGIKHGPHSYEHYFLYFMKKLVDNRKIQMASQSCLWTHFQWVKVKWWREPHLFLYVALIDSIQPGIKATSFGFKEYYVNVTVYTILKDLMADTIITVILNVD